MFMNHPFEIWIDNTSLTIAGTKHYAVLQKHGQA
ncbi:hypothetical protein BROSI_A1469 [Candidatus Brocadia sinica JPN1]|uniref:Transposase n=1 Tax=Candidatus Brocadia sinica JPN1 TaxID=1197129 RepID=A0ABQ0JW70_9BACT|nr:hypothetical protein BROSI_A1469 [Candidatus Brocadia sinica JPN1]